MPADGGGSVASALRDHVPAAEVFEARKQVGVGELHERVTKAVESSGGNAEEVVRNVMMLATEGADDIKNNLEKIRKTFDEDPEAPFRISISKELSDKIKDLEEGPRAAVEKAFAQFEESLRKTVKAALPEASRSEDPPEALEIRPGTDSSEAVNAIDKQMEDLQEKIDFEEKKEKLINSKRKFPASEKTVSKELGRLNEEMKVLIAERTALLQKEAAEAAVPASATTEKVVEAPVVPAAAEAVKPLGISASFAEAARKIQEKNAAEAETKLGGFIDGLIDKASRERKKQSASPLMVGVENISAARFESDKPILIARYLLRLIEGDKRTRRKTPNERWEKVKAANGVESDHMIEDLSGPDEFEEYTAGESKFSAAGVLNVAKRKYGYTGEDTKIVEAIRAKAGEELSSEKKAGTGDFAKGASDAEKKAADREELDRVSEQLGVLSAEARRLGAAFSEADQEKLDGLKVRRDELMASISGVAFKFPPKKAVEPTPAVDAGTSGSKEGSEAAPLSEGERTQWGSILKEHEGLVSSAEALRGQWEGSTEIDADVEGWLQWGRSLVDAERSFLDSKTQDDRTTRGKALLEALKNRPTNAKALDTVIQRVRGDADKLEIDASKGLIDKKEADSAQTFIEDHFDKRTDAYNQLKIKKEKIDAMVAELETSFGAAGVTKSVDASAPVAPDVVPPTPDAQPPVEVFTDAERKEMSNKAASGEKVLAEAEAIISALESPDLVSDEQKGEVEWVKGGYKTLIDTYRNLSDAKTVEEKTKARDRYETAKAVIGDKAQREIIVGIRDGLAKALKETSSEVLATKTPEIQQQEKVLRNYALALKSLLEGIGEHVAEIGSIKVDAPELTTIPSEPTPDPAPSSAVDAPPVVPSAPPDAPKDPVVTPDASSPDPDGPEYGPKTHVEHEEELLRRIDGLLDKMSERQDLDKGDAAVVFGDLGEVLIRAQEGMELLEEASRETNELKRQDLLVKRDVILRDPEILGKAEAYMKKMVESMRTTSPEDMQEDTELATRIELFEVITELFPALAKKVGALKENQQEATTLDFRERQGWQSWIKENGKRIEAAGEVLKKSVGDEWYKKNKVSVDAGLAFQEGVLKRTEAVLAAKTPKEREALDKDLVEFRRRASEVPRLVPDQTAASVGAKIEEIKAASKALDTTEKDEGKRKAAQAKREVEISELRRLLSILALDQDIQNERELHTAISDEQVTAEVQRRREMNAMREPGTERVSESVEDVYKETERVAGEHHEEMRGLVSVGKAMRKLFTESLAQCHPSAENAKTFSPVYEAWNEEQEASLELVDANRERGFLDHLEVWVTQGLRTLDQSGEETLSEEAWKNMTEEGGEEHEFADLLDPNERNVEAIKARLYDIMRKATQDKVQAQQKRLEVEQRAQKADGITREELEAKRGAVEGAVEKATLELSRLSNTIKTMQAGASRGGNAIRWAREGNTLLEQEKILRHARDGAMEKKADFDELAAILTEKKQEGSSSDEKEAATLPFALQEGVNTRLAALMKKQTERAQTTEAARAAAIQGIYKANPRMMDVEIKSTSSGKMGGEIKRESLSGGTAPKGAYESFKSSWAGKLMSPFLSVFEGLFK